VLEKVQRSVVSVYPATLLKEAKDGDDKAFLDRYFGKKEDGKEGEPGRRENGHGSGVIVGADGIILTNNHVVRTAADTLADEIMVELHTGRRYPAKIIGTDPLTDIAVLKMDPVPDGPPLPIADSNNVRVADLVFAIGNPFEVGMTVTMGCVSATHRRGLNMGGPGSYEDFIQTDASINPGNSGGALVDAAGRLVGINSAIRNAGGGGNIGIGFAVPSQLAVWVADQLIAKGRVTRSRLGVDVTTSKPDATNPAGVKITAVQPDSPADKAGLKKDDLLTAIDDQPVPDESALRLRSSLMPPGQPKKVAYVREGKPLTVDIAFAEIADDGASRLSGDGSAEILPGVTLSVSTDPKGLKVDAVKEGSPMRLSAGQIITQINSKAIASISEARAALRRGVNQVRVLTDGKPSLVALRLAE
jgi:serine protease Do/serine protease DegQ